MSLRDNTEYFIRQNWKLWEVMRDGGKDPDGGPDWPGFWKRADGKPIGPGDPVPKEAYRGMVGAIKYLLSKTGVLWREQKKREHSADAFREAAARSDLGKSFDMAPRRKDDDEAKAKDEDEPDEDDD